MPNLKQNEFMTEEQKDQIRKQLLEERDEIVGEIGALRRREERTTFEVGADFAERAELEAERIVEHQLSMDDAYLIAKVDLALQRLVEGTYENCLQCGTEIPIERLMAKPSVSLCIDCQKKKEAS
tara:strand:+ start:5679 stop:6053 length:375 start_codon:yes stop_codon:yes gene_type:complete